MPGSHSMKRVRALAVMSWVLVKELALELELEWELESCDFGRTAMGMHSVEMRTTAHRLAGHTKKKHHNHRWGYNLLVLLWALAS